MTRWASYSFFIYSKIFGLCFLTGYALALIFDLAAESDKWFGSTADDMIFRALSIGLYFTPICLWVSLLITLLRWQITKELKLLHRYNVSKWKASKGVSLSMALIILCWFGVRESVWIQLVDHEQSDSRTVLFELNEGTVLIEKLNNEEGYASIWFEINRQDFIYPKLLFQKGSWKLKENINRKASVSKQDFEAKLNAEFPFKKGLDLHFMASSNLGLFELNRLDESKTWYRILLPFFSFLYLCSVWMKIIYLNRGSLWKGWSISFLLFIMLTSFSESLLT